MNSFFHKTPLLPVLTALLMTAHLASAGPASKYHRATISPSIVHLQPGESASFKVIMVATRLMAALPPKEVIWGVNDIPGGNAALGSIDGNGLYTAPSEIPSPREIHLSAEVPDAANRFLYATVIIGEGEPEYRAVHIWGEPVEEGKGTEHFVDPHGIGIDVEGNLLISDQEGSAVRRFTPEGKYLGDLGLGSGSEPGQFTEPRIAMADAEGRIFVSDSKGDRPRIQVFSNDGEFLKIFAEKGRPPGMILRAHGMDFDAQGRIFTADVDNMRVNVYDRDGNFLYEWGEEGPNLGQFNAPHGLCVDKSGDVFVNGYYGPTQKFSAEGDFLFAFCYGDPPDGPVYFHNLTGDRWGNVYVMVRSKEGYQGQFVEGEAKRISIMKFNNNGDYITGWSFSSTDHRETSATVSEDGRVYALFVGSKEMGVETFEQE